MKRRFSLVIVILTCFCALLVTAFASAPFLVSGAGSAFEHLYGYRVHVDRLSLTSGPGVRISDLRIDGIKGRGFVFASGEAAIESRITKVFRGEVERIVLKSPKLQFRLGDKKAKNDLSFIKKIPPVQLLTVEKGEIRLLFVPDKGEILLKDIALNVENFSPKAGGNLTFKGLLHIAFPQAKGIDVHGVCTGKLSLTSLFPRPIGKGHLEVSVDDGIAGETGFRKTTFNLPVSFGQEGVQLSGIRVTSQSITLQKGKVHSEFKDVQLEADTAYEWESRTLSIQRLRGEIPSLGVFTGAYRGTLEGNFPWQGSMEATGIDFARVFAALAPFIKTSGIKQWSFQGKGNMNLEFAGNLSGPQAAINGKAILDFQDGGFSSQDGTTAGQGIGGTVVFKFSLPSESKKADIKVHSGISRGEYLWGRYYKDLTKENRGFAAELNLAVARDNKVDYKGTLDLFGTGEYSFSGSADTKGWSFSFAAEKVPQERVLALFFREYLAENYPYFKALEVGGLLGLDIQVRNTEGRYFIEGTARIHNASMMIADKAIAIEGVDSTIPFSLLYPIAATGPPEIDGTKMEQVGLITVKGIRMDTLNLKDLNIPLTISRNNLRILKSIDVPLFNGLIRLSECRGENILSSSRRFSVTATIEHVDLTSLLRTLTGFEFPGTMGARFPLIKYDGERWVTEGKTSISVFGGEIEAVNVYAKDLFSPARTIGGDIFFRDMDLSSVTDAIKVGRITGVVQGSLTGLEIEYGQPSRFSLDIESVEKRGVEQKISVDAIENISILGTGSGGVGLILRSGINRFFKEYPYSRLGIACTLANDNLHIRGKIHEGGTEYFIRKGFLRGVDVINRDPGSTLSFKDMQERLGRVVKKQGKGATSPQVSIN